MPEIDLPQLMRINEVALVLQVSKTTVYRLIQEGELRAIRFAGVTVRVLPDDLTSFINSHHSDEKCPAGRPGGGARSGGDHGPNEL